MKLEGCVALVTGASGGIGKSTAIAFAKEGAKVPYVRIKGCLVNVQRKGVPTVSLVIMLRPIRSCRVGRGGSHYCFTCRGSRSSMYKGTGGTLGLICRWD